MKVKHKLIEKREYQLRIAERASSKNTLVVLPTGMGKTIIALLVAEKRLSKYPASKILFLAPTRPLCNQHKKTFEKLSDAKGIVITGRIKAEKRKELYKTYNIIFATPQTIRNDLQANSLSLQNFSLAIFDEAHRAVGNYAYVYIAKQYVKQSKFPLILALTASPGSTEEKIQEILKNLFINQVEIRTHFDVDVRPYLQPLKKEFVYVSFDEKIKEIIKLFKSFLQERIDWLKQNGLLAKKPNKSEIIALQRKIAEQYKKSKNTFLALALIKLSEMIKVMHALELLESQGISVARDYLLKLKKSKKQVDRRIASSKEILLAIARLEEVFSKGYEHPKLSKLLSLAKQIHKQGKQAIIFANYRKTCEMIASKLNEQGMQARVFVGQARKGKTGMSQKEQIMLIESFKAKNFSFLVSTSIGEEGIDIPEVDYVIFYEPIPSEIRSIQRKGRVGRTKPGMVIFLITKGTRDESYYWAAFHKEKKMRKMLKEMQKKGIKKKTLKDWLS